MSGLAVGFLALSILLVWGGLAVSVAYLVRHRLPDDDEAPDDDAPGEDDAPGGGVGSTPGGGVGSTPAGGEAPHS